MGFCDFKLYLQLILLSIFPRQQQFSTINYSRTLKYPINYSSLR